MLFGISVLMRCFDKYRELPVIIGMPAASSNKSLQIANINTDFVSDYCKELDRFWTLYTVYFVRSMRNV